jgi:peroxiredoxin Q/BCP
MSYVLLKDCVLQYPVLSDVGGKARKAYRIARFLFWPSTRTTFIIDKAGKIRFVFIFTVYSVAYPICRAVLDATVNNGAHAKFVKKELDKLAAEDDNAHLTALEQAFSTDVNASTYAIPAL